MKALKRTLGIFILMSLSFFVWFLWFIIKGCEKIMEMVEILGDKLFSWVSK